MKRNKSPIKEIFQLNGLMRHSHVSASTNIFYIYLRRRIRELLQHGLRIFFYKNKFLKLYIIVDVSDSFIYNDNSVIEIAGKNIYAASDAFVAATISSSMINSNLLGELKINKPIALTKL